MRNRVEKEAAILWCLNRAPGMYATKLCKITGLWRSGIYIHLARMEEGGLIYSTKDIGPYPQRYRYFARQPAEADPEQKT